MNFTVETRSRGSWMIVHETNDLSSALAKLAEILRDGEEARLWCEHEVGKVA